MHIVKGVIDPQFSHPPIAGHDCPNSSLPESKATESACGLSVLTDQQGNESESIQTCSEAHSPHCDSKRAIVLQAYSVDDLLSLLRTVREIGVALDTHEPRASQAR